MFGLLSQRADPGNLERLMKRFVVVAAFAFLLVPNAAFGQATRTWVSGVGDDVNPCSRTAPCKTFAGAISKTAVKGEINVLDPGGFGAVTITKSITIVSHSPTAGVLVSGTNGIVISAAATDRVTLRGLDINGLGTGLNGIDVISAKTVRVEDSEIYGFTTAGIAFKPSNVDARMIVTNTKIHDNTGDGVSAVPPGGGSGRVTISDSQIDANARGVVASGGPVLVTVMHSSMSDNAGLGLTAIGASAFAMMGGNTMVGNGGAGFAASGGGAIGTFGTNSSFANGAADGATQPTTTLRTKVKAREARARARARARAHPLR
jgi:hypothetical protein